jgi:hypothetical protein
MMAVNPDEEGDSDEVNSCAKGWRRGWDLCLKGSSSAS